MSEPDFLSQCADPFADDDARHKWFHERAAEAKAKGATWCRYTIHPERGWTLFEGWKVRPENDGEPRWQIASPETV